MENLNKGHRQRMRERYIREGKLDNFHDHEVLEMLLFLCIPHRDTNKIAHALINKFGSLPEVFDAEPKALTEIKGISEITATNICFLKDVWSRYVKTTKRKRDMSSKSEIIKFAKEIFAVSRYEELVVAYLDFASNYLGHNIYSTNSTNSINVSPKEIVSGALKSNAAGVILLHGHIKGECIPSPSDIKFTEQLYLAFSGLNIVMLDHIILNDTDGHFSFRQQGIIDNFSKKLQQ